MALDGIEGLLAARFLKMKVHFIRYADDFLVTAPTKEIAEEARDIIQEFLAERGLELSMEKTVITYIDDGVDFLGYNFRKYKGKLLIKPSRKSIESITNKIQKNGEESASLDTGCPYQSPQSDHSRMDKLSPPQCGRRNIQGLG